MGLQAELLAAGNTPLVATHSPMSYRVAALPLLAVGTISALMATAGSANVASGLAQADNIVVASGW
jgi:hypothetical protein